MFAASATPSISFLPLPPTAKRLHYTAVVSAQFRARTTAAAAAAVKDDDDHDGFNQKKNVGSIGHAVFTASSSKPVNQSPIRKESSQQQQPLLSGSDVLRALSKAAAEKAKAKKKNQKGTQTPGASKIIRGGGVGGTKAVPDVLPLQVKEEEWGVRLEHLQNRLHDLKLETF